MLLIEKYLNYPYLRDSFLYHPPLLPFLIPHTLPAFLLACTDIGAAVIVEESLTFDSSFSPIS